MGVCKSADEVRQAVQSGLTLCHSTAEVMGSLETRSGLVMAYRWLRGGCFISPVAGCVTYQKCPALDTPSGDASWARSSFLPLALC